MEVRNGDKLTVQGPDTPVPAIAEGAKTGPPSSRSYDCYTTLKGAEGGHKATTWSEEEELLRSGDELSHPQKDAGIASGSGRDLGNAAKGHSTPRSGKDREGGWKVVGRRNPFREREKASRMSPSNQRREDMRHSRFFIRKYEETMAAGREPTPTDLDHYQWALSTMEKYDSLDKREANSSAADSGKRNRSHDASGREDAKKAKRNTPTDAKGVSRAKDTRHGGGSSSGSKEKETQRGSGSKATETHRKQTAVGTKKHPIPPRFKFLDNLPLNEIVKLDLKVAIVDKSTTDLRISPENYGRVESAIFDGIYDLITKQPLCKAPVFSSKERFRGYIVVNCDCQSSVEFLKATVGKMGAPWKDAQLEVMLLRELPALPKAFVNIPLSVDTKQVGREFGERTLAVLKAQNLDMPMMSWKLLRVGNIVKRSVLMTFAIDKESLVALDKKGDVLNLCMREVRVYTSKGGLIIDEEKDKEESIIADLMEEDPAVDNCPSEPTN